MKEMIVPVYPEKFDMVKIHGEAIGDIWLGHVQSVDFKNQHWVPRIRWYGEF